MKSEYVLTVYFNVDEDTLEQKTNCIQNYVFAVRGIKEPKGLKIEDIDCEEIHFEKQI